MPFTPMTGHPLTKTITSLLLASLLAATSAAAESVSRISTRFLARGEKALLEIGVTGSQPTAFPDIPAVNGVMISPTGRGPKPNMLPGRRLEYVFQYHVSSYETGKHTIPAFTIQAGGTTSRTEPVNISIFNPDELVWSETLAGDTPIRYATAFRVLDTRPFVGENIPVEIKLFVPSDLFVEDWGIPDFERDGATAWRFQPSDSMVGTINLLGLPYRSVAYPSTLSPTRDGSVSIGPAAIRLIVTQVVLDAIRSRVSKEVNIRVPRLELEARPLPPGAPAGFENAIGRFRMEVGTTTGDVREGDPVPLDLVVTGSGNLDTLRPPKPVDAGDWKVYEPIAEQRGSERRELSGSAVFHQFLRPLTVQSQIPSFRLVFFDPSSEIYQTLSSPPIPITMIPAPAPAAGGFAPPQALPVPVERMTDILGLIRNPLLARSNSSAFPRWSGHALAGLLALALVARALWIRHGHRFRRDPARAIRLAEIREIERIRKDDRSFLMSAGRFIERRLGANPAGELHDVLTQRDSLCFHQQPGDKCLLDAGRRKEIVRLLRKSALCALFLITLGTTTRARAGEPGTLATEAFQAARYDEAIAHWLSAAPYDDLTADALYNIGNACYRAGSAGHAALYYRRALTRDPGHQESLQNLRFIARKHGSITVHRPEYQDALARFPLASWKAVFWSGAWLCLLAALVFPATRGGARVRLAAVAGLILGPLIAATGALGWHYFPDDAEFAPLDRQAVIIGENAVLHTDAARTAPEIIDSPPGSICEVIRKSGDWVYVAFATKTRGWLPVHMIEMIEPDTPPEPPEIRKPKATGKNA